MVHAPAMQETVPDGIGRTACDIVRGSGGCA
jgi:hypothetical protein